MRICVFCGSAPGATPEYREAADELAVRLVERKIELVYGGASVGTMGALADAVLRAGGRVIGVMPQHLVDREVAHHGLSELRVVKSMHERKALMAELSDGFISLPGGLGTLDEMFECLTWTQLGLQSKPIGLLNVRNFYTKLLEFLDHAVLEGFIRPAHRELLLAASSPGALLDAFASYRVPTIEKWVRPLRSDG